MVVCYNFPQIYNNLYLTKINILYNSKQNNTNLLINWNFTNPINQRNFKSGNYNDTNVYTIDRWITYRTTIELTNEGLSVMYNTANSNPNKTGGLIQRFPYTTQYIGFPITMTMLTTTKLYTYTFTFPETGYVHYDYIENGKNTVSFVIGQRNNSDIFFQISFYNVTPIIIKYVKAEIGNIQTLTTQINEEYVLNDIWIYEEQLMKCRYYFQIIFCGNLVGFSDDSTQIAFPLNYSTRMRIPNPTSTLLQDGYIHKLLTTDNVTKIPSGTVFQQSHFYYLDLSSYGTFEDNILYTFNASPGSGNTLSGIVKIAFDAEIY